MRHFLIKQLGTPTPLPWVLFLIFNTFRGLSFTIFVLIGQCLVKRLMDSFEGWGVGVIVGLNWSSTLFPNIPLWTNYLASHHSSLRPSHYLTHTSNHPHDRFQNNLSFRWARRFHFWLPWYLIIKTTQQNNQQRYVSEKWTHNHSCLHTFGCLSNWHD